MNKLYRFAAAAAALTIAASATSCASPDAITFGKGAQKAMTIDGYEIPAGVFVYNEIYAYNNAAYTVYAQDGTYPSVADVKAAKLDNLDATDWIQNKATEFCIDFVATEREFEKIGGQLSEDQLTEIDLAVSSSAENTLFSENGVGEESIRKIIENSYKQEEVFKHYYGLDAEKGCSEDELKDYFKDKTARVRYFSVNLEDNEGNKFDDDKIHEITKLVDGYVKEINAEKTNDKKMEKIVECEKKYNEYLAKEEEKAAAEAAAEAEENGEEVTTTAATTTAAAETTTTTTEKYYGEVTVTKYTTTAADTDTETTETEAAEESDYQKSRREYSEFVFGKLENYKAEKYQYDDTTLYVVIKGDIEERMTDDDMWSEDSIESLLSERYYSDFQDMMKKIAETYTAEKNSSAFRKFSPFKLILEEK